MSVKVTYQSNVHFDSKGFKKKAQYLLDLLGYRDFDLGILLTDNEIIHEYNKTYRDKDKPTDVLSFPFYPELKAGEVITPENEDDKQLGDLIISLEYTQNDAPRWEQTFEKRMDVLLIHGICHLLGYDHEIDQDYEVMKVKEEELLHKLELYEKK